MKYCLAILALIIMPWSAANSEAATLNQRLSEAIDIVSARQNSSNPIPQTLIDHSKGIAIIKVTKAGFVLGGAYGQGLVLVHHEEPWSPIKWSAPSCVNITGGSLGAQVGMELKRYILIINSPQALALFSGNGDVKWDATAAGTMGQQTAHASASQLAQLPILVYQDSGGVFGGATFGGTTVSVDAKENHKAYGPLLTTHDILDGKVKINNWDQRLYDLLEGKR